MPSYIVAAHLHRDHTDSHAVIKLPDAFNDHDAWFKKFGPNWSEMRWRAADCHVALNFGFDWQLDYLDEFDSHGEYLEEFACDTFLDGCDFTGESDD